MRSIIGIILLSTGLLMIAGAGMSGFPTAMHTGFGITLSSAVGMLAVFGGTLLTRTHHNTLTSPTEHHPHR